MQHSDKGAPLLLSYMYLLLWGDHTLGYENLEVVEESDDAMRIGLGHGIVHVLPNVRLPVLLPGKRKEDQIHFLALPHTLSSFLSP